MVLHFYSIVAVPVYELHHIHSRQKKMGIAFPDVDLSFMYSCTKAEALDRWDSMDGVGWSAACDLLSQHVGLVWQNVRECRVSLVITDYKMMSYIKVV